MTNQLTFLDLCSGIGGFRSGLEKAGMKCVGYVEIDKYARKSYEAMYDTTDEWSDNDIRSLSPTDLPRADIWCFGFPCQDISVAGRKAGLSGSRSNLFYDILELLEGQDPENKPVFLLIENVKNLLSISEGQGFAEVLTALAKAGYDCEWTVLNSKDFGVPQNRERVFIVGHLRGRGTKTVLFRSRAGRQPVEEDGKRVNQIIPGNQAHRVYDSDGLSVTIKAEGGGVGAKTGLYAVPKIDIPIPEENKSDIEEWLEIIDWTPLNSQEYSDFADGYMKGYIKAFEDSKKLKAYPCLTPDRVRKRQNGRRFKEAEDPMFTLTAQDRHGVLLHNNQEYYIRRLTPRECFRLQGFSDEQFDKAEEVCSNTQLYKQAGNAVTVNVAEYLGRLIKESV